MGNRRRYELDHLSAPAIALLIDHGLVDEWPLDVTTLGARAVGQDRRKAGAIVQAEELVLRYADEHGVPAVAMCVSTTYGGGDWNMTPQGAMVAGAAFGKIVRRKAPGSRTATHRGEWPMPFVIWAGGKSGTARSGLVRTFRCQRP